MFIWWYTGLEFERLAKQIYLNKTRSNLWLETRFKCLIELISDTTSNVSAKGGQVHEKKLTWVVNGIKC